MNSNLIEKQISRKVIYENNFLNIYEDEVLLPNKKTSTRICLNHIGASAVLPIFEDNTVLLIKQFRYSVGKVFYEIPAGKKDEKNEDILKCIMRELEEETGYKAENYKYITTIHPAVGFCDEAINIFMATNLSLVEDKMKCDDDEFIEVVRVSIKDAYSMILDGTISDAKTIIAIQHYLLSINNV